MNKVYAEVSSCGKAGRIDVGFPYSREDVRLIKTVGGASFVERPNKHWHVPLDLQACRSLRIAFGDRLTIGPNLRSWAIEERRREDTLGSLAQASTATLKRLPHALPSLYEAVHLGPLGRFMTPEQRAEAMLTPASYQAADAAFVAEAVAPLVGNEQGTGKTITYIAGIWEAGLEEGCHLVICPRAAVDGTWDPELRRWQEGSPKKVEVFACVDSTKDRYEALQRFVESDAPVKWVIVNKEMIRYIKDDTRTSKITMPVKGAKAQMDACYCSRSKGAHEHYVSKFPVLHNTTWTTLCFDEAHKGGVRNHRSLTSQSAENLKVAPNGKRAVLTGTPMKKKGGSDIWGILHWLRPDAFTSFWRFAGDFFQIEDNGFGKKVGDLIPGREQALFAALAPFMLRRLKSEVAPWLPPKHYVDVPVFMSAKQAKQYAKMEQDSVVSVSGQDVTVTNTLAMFTRLKQFANGLCEVRDGELVPVESAKVEAMLEKMDEAGMFDEGATRKQLVFSQSKRMVKFVAEQLRAKGLKVDVISGDNNKSAERKRIMSDFQEGDTRVLVIVTTAGGVSLTLDAADEVHLLDEMWSPDEDVQAEDRAHRVSRIHQVTIFIYRAIGTIDEYVADTKEEKAATHEFIMDVRRKIMSKYGKG